jgi:hypothetical protein
MDKNIKILIVLGILITIGAAYYDIYLGGIVGILFLSLIMSMMIMKDTTGIPEVMPKLAEDGKSIVLTNTGNARAEKIHVNLMPSNLEFDIATLEIDSAYQYPLEKPVEEIKIKITYCNEKGRLFSSTKKLSVFEEEPDLLKPMFPTFGWKK